MSFLHPSTPKKKGVRALEKERRRARGDRLRGHAVFVVETICCENIVFQVVSELCSKEQTEVEVVGTILQCNISASWFCTL